MRKLTNRGHVFHSPQELRFTFDDVLIICRFQVFHGDSWTRHWEASLPPFLISIDGASRVHSPALLAYTDASIIGRVGVFISLRVKETKEAITVRDKLSQVRENSKKLEMCDNLVSSDGASSFTDRDLIKIELRQLEWDLWLVV